MNFYLAQEEARKQSQRLILLFCLAVFVLVVLTNALFITFVWFSDFGNLAGVQRIDVSALPWHQALLAIIDNFGWDKIAIVSAIIVSVIAVATWSKWSDLSKGGHVVAELLGGKRVSPDTKEPHERRLINVVEEMALAANMAVPPVYVLTIEQGINAFAAGVSSDDAVVAVSQGALMQLNRDQLQGVVAHEFSHILNGDMRLNVRVVATLHGLTMINETGRILMEAGSRRRYRRSYGFSNSSRKNNGGQIVVFIAGLALWLLGTVGQFFGEVIKAALSRQREYLADASAVQFTRNPTGIGEALQIIGGYGKRSKIDNPRAHELGHFFFSAAFNSRVFATHPPIDERIERLLPNWSGQYVASTAEVELRSEFGDAVMRFSGGSLHAEDLAKAAQSEAPETSAISFESQEKTTIEPLFNLKSLLERVHTSHDAKGVYYAFIGHDSVATNDWSERITLLSLSQTVDLLRAAIPALKTLSKEEYSAFRSSYLQVISADKKRSLSEWLGFELFRNPCDRFFGLAKPVKPKYKNIESIASFYRIVVTKFVQIGTRTTRDQLTAIEAAGKASGIDLAGTKLALNISTKEFTAACNELKKAYPLLTPRLVKGLLAAAEVDGKVCEIEQKLVSILAAIWDLPLPALEMSELNKA